MVPGKQYPLNSIAVVGRLMGRRVSFQPFLKQILRRFQECNNDVVVLHTTGLPFSCTLGRRWDVVMTRSDFKSETVF